MTLTVTCFIPEESEELGDDALEDDSDSDYVDIPNVSTNRKLTANDPVVLNDLAHYMDHNVVGAGNILPKRRSSEFMLSYLGPIDEAAEDDADADTDDLVPDRSHSLQPDDSLNNIKIEPSNNEEQEMAYNINASPTVEDAYHLCHEPTEKLQHDNVVPTRGTEEPVSSSSLSSVHDFRVTAVVDNGCKTKCFDDKEQAFCDESRSSVENPGARNDVNAYERHNPWFSFHRQDSVGHAMGRNEYFSEDSVDVAAHNSRAATNVAEVSYLRNDSNKHATTAEHKTLTNISAPLHTGSEDHTGNTGNIFMPFAAESTCLLYTSPSPRDS